MGAASHWYFAVWTGLLQGIEEWDLSAKPRDGQGDNDTSVTSRELADAALRQLKKASNTSGRFFAWYHFFDPHAQYMPHEGAPDFREPGRGGISATRAAYDAEVWFTDKHIGRILDYVASQPWGERTAIVVTADHGEAFAEHGMSWHGVDIWESLVRVPLVVYVPGTKPQHITVKRSHIDLVPTILELFGIASPGPTAVSGQSLLDDVLRENGEPLVERDVVFDMPAGPYTAMRKGIITGSTPGMKLISSGGGQYQLFDLARDPGELEDLSGERDKLRPVLNAFNASRSRIKEIFVKPDEPKNP
jgi:arylsulfatase A-like enzyme